MSAHELFVPLPSWQVLVCRGCRHAVWPAEVVAHLGGEHHHLKASTGRGIGEELDGWHGIAATKSGFEVPQSLPEAIPELALFRDGLQCCVDAPRCGYVSRGLRTMKNHWRTAHQWPPQVRRGRPPATPPAASPPAGCRPVSCQRFFVSGPHSQYFAVPPGDEGALSSAPPDQDAWTAMWTEATALEQAQRDRTTIHAGAIDEANPWLHQTGWLDLLAGCDGRELRAAIGPPDAGEEIATAIWQAMATVATVCQDTVARSSVTLRFEVVRPATAAGARDRPLRPYQNPKDITQRCRPWQEMLMFFYRAQAAPSRRSPPYHFTTRQATAWTAVVTAAATSAGAAADAEDGSSAHCSPASDLADEEDGSSTRSGADSPTTPPPLPPPPAVMAPLPQACLRFCITLLDQTVECHEREMAMIVALAVMGVHPSGQGWQGAATYPSVLSAVIKVAQFMVLRRAVDLAGRPSSPASDADLEGHAPPPAERQSVLAWVRHLAGRFMFRGSAGPMQWMLDLRAYGLAIAHTTTAAGHVRWQGDDELTFKHLRFRMADFRAMVAQLESTTRGLLAEVLAVPDTQALPPVPWTQLYDDPSNPTLAWDFTHDPRTKWPVDGDAWMYHRVQQDVALRTRFCRAGALHAARLHDWLRGLDRFRGRLLALMHLAGGQPARGTELLSVRYRNTAHGGHRNLFIEDGLVVMVTRYHKSYHKQGVPKTIHRYLPHAVSELVIWYCWLVLPFARRLELFLFPTEELSSHLWPATGTYGRYSTDRLTTELQTACRAGLGQPINVADYRHIAIAIRRRWSVGSEATLEAAEGESPSALGIGGGAFSDEIGDAQAAHTSLTAGAIYAREATEMAGVIASQRLQFRRESLAWHRCLGFLPPPNPHGLKRSRPGGVQAIRRARLERRRRLRQMDPTAALSTLLGGPASLRGVQADAIRAVQDGLNQIVVVMPTGSGKSMVFLLPAAMQPSGVTVVVVPLRALEQDLLYRCTRLGVTAVMWDAAYAADAASVVLVTPERTQLAAFGDFLARLRMYERLDRIVIDECHLLLNDDRTFRRSLQKLGALGAAETQMVLLTATLPPSDEAELFRRMDWYPQDVTLVRMPTSRANITYRLLPGSKDPRKHLTQLESLTTPVLQQPEGKVLIICGQKVAIAAIVEARWFPCDAYHAGLPEDVRADRLTAFREGDIRVLVATNAFGLGVDIPDIVLTIHADEPDTLLDFAQMSGRGGRDGRPCTAILLTGRTAYADERMQRYLSARECRRIGLDTYLDGSGMRTSCVAGEAPCDWCQAAAAISSTATPDWGLPNPVPVEPIVGGPIVVQPVPIEPPGQPAPAEGAVRPREAPRTPLDQAAAAHESGQMDEEIARQAWEDHSRRQPHQRRIQAVRDGEIEQDTARRYLARWKGRCLLCFSRGTSDSHIITRCPNNPSRVGVDYLEVLMKQLRYPPHVVCFKCGLPPVLCARWGPDGRTFTSSVPCPYLGVIMSVIASIPSVYPKLWEDLQVRAATRGWKRVEDPQLLKFWASPIKSQIGTQLYHAFLWVSMQIDSGNL